MELDDLKQAWQQQTPEDIDVRNNKNIIDMIKYKRYGPVASIRSIFGRAFWLAPIMAGIIIFMIVNKDTRNDILMWSLILILVPILIFYFYWYKKLGKIQHDENPIKGTLENNVIRLEKGLKILYFSTNLLAFLLLICIMELPIFLNHKTSGYNWWRQNVPVYLRCLAYLAFGVYAYFSSKKTQYRFFGQHIDYLKELLRKME
ncbi:hypothetical protein A9P82_00360 [Arachidicoccus ginsenosidimutans]|uniref:hypothetical protein n=1 Tax=Arachidicoccus sp. BS20 TaxID=1850526 RepID=UPI0007F075D9|nr:hypothetical protein [Arachidicoccus sp. BS20]ANI87906.1 hypothetical protein A9P82_00360 [Arachidicoccus sp. BS20]